jgi:hypothetical protein
MITAFDGRNQDNQSTFYSSTPHDLPTSEAPPPLPVFNTILSKLKTCSSIRPLIQEENCTITENIGHYEPIIGIH